MTTREDLDALAKSVEAAKDYVDCIVKPPLQQLGGLLSDTVGYWRLKNRVNLLLKIKRYLDQQGVKPVKLLPDTFVPLVEEAGNTADETLAEMFARLGATQLDAETAGKAHPSFAKTLGQLSPLDVRVLRMIDVACEENHNRLFHNARLPRVPIPGKPNAWGWNAAHWKRETILSAFGIIDDARSRWNVTADQASLSMMNLQRLGLIKQFQTNVDDVIGGKCRTWIVTNYAKRLQSACSKPGTYWGQKMDGINERMHESTKARHEQFRRDLAAGKFDNDDDPGEGDPFADLTGNVSGVCPECGAPAATSPPTP